MTDIHDLEDEEQSLLAKLQAVREAKRLEAERLKAEIPIAIRAIALTGAYVLLENDYDGRLVNLLQTIKGRTWNGSKNGIPLAEWGNFISKLEAQTEFKYSLTYAGGVSERIEKQLNAPVWEVKLSGNYLSLIPGQYSNSAIVSRIPGILWDNIRNKWNAPIAEAWRVWETLKDIPGVVYDEATRDFTLKQIEARLNLDKIALAKDWDYPVELGDGVIPRPFQRVGAAFIENTGGNCLLAYQMGLGKTIISMMYAIKNNFRTIVICPASLKPNWAREIKRLAGNPPAIMQGTQPDASDIMKLAGPNANKFTIFNYDMIARSSKWEDRKQDENGDVHLTKYEKYIWVELINAIKPDLVIVDESHYIKNSDSGRSKAVRSLKVPRIIHMTGTPVLNRPGELWPILTMLAPQTFPSEEVFVRQYTYDGKYAKNVDQLKEALKPVMIRRRQQDVIEQMPPLNRITDWHELSAKAKKLYDKVLDGIYQEIELYSAKTGEHIANETSITSILAKIQRLKMVCAIDKVEETADLAIELADSASEEKYNKILIFSQYKAVAFAIAQKLGHEALCFVSRGNSDFITADITERDKLVQEFQNNPRYKYLVVTEKSAKEGHNITKAGFVIFNDLFWTPASHEQGEGRAYMRISDPHGIEAYYRISEMNGQGIEEWIWDLLKSKIRVIEQTVESVEASRDSEGSVAMELINKLKESMWMRR